MRNLTMLSSHPCSLDGRAVQWFMEGQSYEVSDYLAAILLKEGWAKVDPCIGNDPSCPCQDGDACHYREPNAWPPLAVLAVGAAEIQSPGHKQEYSQKKTRK